MIFDDDPDQWLDHHGVKGMKWGIRRDLGKSSDSIVGRLLKENPPKPLTPEQKKHLEENKKKFNAKFQGDEAPTDPKAGRHLTPKEKAALAVGGAAVAGTLIAIALKKAGVKSELKKSFSKDQYKALIRTEERPAWMRQMAGTKMSVTDFDGLFARTSGKIWDRAGYLTKDSFLQKETTFPVGHTFSRMSHAAETKFVKPTYSTATVEDSMRYMGVHGGSHLVEFKAKTEIKIPDLHTRLESMREALVLSGKKNLTPKDVIAAYDARTGGGWTDDLSTKFFHVLKEKGFHGIVDDMDAGVVGDMPLVLFDSSAFTPKVSKALSLSQRTKMTKELVELAHRRAA